MTEQDFNAELKVVVDSLISRAETERQQSQTKSTLEKFVCSV